MIDRLKKLEKLGVFAVSDVEDLGIHQSTLSRWAATGEIKRVARGLFWHPDGDLDADEVDYATACKICGPESYIGLATALDYHDLLDAPPTKIWMMIPYERVVKRKLIRVVRTKGDTSTGIESHKFFRISGVERTIVDALRFSGKLGLDSALKAAMIAIKRNITTPEKILKISQEAKLESSVLQHWEALLGAQEAAISG